MDFKTIRAVINANADKSLSASARLVIVALAVGMFKEGAQCKATVKELASMCNISPRTVKSVIATLKKAGIVGVSANGTANVYTLNGATIAPTGDNKGATIAPMDGGNGATIAPIGATIAPTGGAYIGIEFKENECEKSRGRIRARAHAHARAFEELTEAEAIAAGKLAGVSVEVARQVFADMKANGGGYMTRGGVFVKVTGENLQAAIRTMSKHAKPEQQAAANPKPKAHTAAEVKNAKDLCAERCAMFKAGKCGAGVAVLPALSERPHPPQECRHFKKLKQGGV